MLILKFNGMLDVFILITTLSIAHIMLTYWKPHCLHEYAMLAVYEFICCNVPGEQKGCIIAICLEDALLGV